MVFITEHEAFGTVGIAVNKLSNVSVRQFAAHHNLIIDVDDMIYIGGPDQSRALTMLHSSEWRCSNTMRINSEVSLSSSTDLLKLLSEKLPKQWRLFIGLCTWSVEQLEFELSSEHNFPVWYSSGSMPSVLFDTDPKDQWLETIGLAGAEFAHNAF